MEIYLRVKRKKVTYFISALPSDTVLEIKQKVEESSHKPSDELQLLKKRSDGGGWRVMDDATKIQEAGISNDEVLALSFRTSDGTFEPVDITPFEVEMATSMQPEAGQGAFGLRP